MKKIALLALMGLALAGLLTACGGDDSDPTPVDQFEIVRTSIDTYLSTAGMAPTTTAQVLFDNLNDGNTANDPYVLCVRTADDYAKGHVPGAHNINWRLIGNATNLATLPTDKQIVVYCYTGHTGQVATTCLNAMGFNAVNMKFGMCAWTRDATVRATTAFREVEDSHDYPTETTANALTATYELPDLDVSTSRDAEEIVRAAAADYTADAAVSPTITAQTVFDNINDGNAANDYFILSVRSNADYLKGHVPGAYNIPYKEIAKVANLEKLPTDKTIVVYCYTGHTGAVATTALRMLGYQAVNMKFGMTAWTRDATVRATTAFREVEDSHDYPFNTGVNP
jgi:rhodanese-related sulfurtransferase